MPAGTRRNRRRSNDERYRTRRRVRRRVHPRFPGTKKWVVPSALLFITLAPKKLIRTRRASEGNASEPSLARRVSMCKDAKLSCRGNTAWECRLVSKPREYVHLLTERLLALTDVLDLVGDLLALDDEGDLGTVEGKSHRVRLLKVFVNYFSYNHRRLDGLIQNELLELKSSASLLLFSDPLLSLQKMHTPLGVTGHEDRAVRREAHSVTAASAWKTATSSRFPQSHSRTAPSDDPETAHRPSDVNATD